jgi:hypothetical protein
VSGRSRTVSLGQPETGTCGWHHSWLNRLNRHDSGNAAISSAAGNRPGSWTRRPGPLAQACGTSVAGRSGRSSSDYGSVRPPDFAGYGVMVVGAARLTSWQRAWPRAAASTAARVGPATVRVGWPVPGPGRRGPCSPGLAEGPDLSSPESSGLAAATTYVARLLFHEPTSASANGCAT